MDKGSKKRPRDTNKLAKRIVDIVTGEVDETVPGKAVQPRKAASKGGKTRASVLTPERRSEIARLAAEARWKKKD